MDILKSIGHYFKNTDLYLLGLALMCSCYGMVLIYSATLNPVSWQDGSTRNLFVQGAAIILGVGAFVVMSLIDLENMSGWWKIFVIANILLQFLLFTPLGVEQNGQRAWINLGVTNMQPGELGKLIFIFTFAAHISEIRDHISEWQGLVVLGAHTLIMMGAVVISSGDTGMAIQYMMIAAIMLFTAGLPLKWFGIVGGIGVVSIPFLWKFVLKNYQKNRILVLFDPSIDPNTSLQTTYGKIAIGAGRLTGQGLTHGTMTQMQNVPENQTDMIFTVSGEELGFIGSILIIILLACVIGRLFYVCLPRVHAVFHDACDRRGGYAAVPDVHEPVHVPWPAARYGPDTAVLLLRRHVDTDYVRRPRHRRRCAHEGKAELAAKLNSVRS